VNILISAECAFLKAMVYGDSACSSSFVMKFINEFFEHWSLGDVLGPYAWGYMEQWSLFPMMPGICHWTLEMFSSLVTGHDLLPQRVSSVCCKPTPDSLFCPEIALSFPVLPGCSCVWSHAQGIGLGKIQLVFDLCHCDCKLYLVLLVFWHKIWFGVGAHLAASPHIFLWVHTVSL
jgi:hypothetical protein